MNWPRGKYNGARIVGFSVKVVFDVTYWALALGNRYGSATCIGQFRIWLEPAYNFDRSPSALRPTTSKGERG